MVNRQTTKPTKRRTGNHGAKTKNIRSRKKELAKVVFVKPTPASPLRGIVPTHPEIEEVLAHFLEGLPASNAARQRMRDDLKMQYYFGGHPILFRRTDQGIEVLAVGDEEVSQLYKKKRKMLAAAREAIVLG